MTKGESVNVAKRAVVAHKTASQMTGKRNPKQRRPFFVTTVVGKSQKRKRRSRKRRKRCILSVVDERELIQGLLPTPSSEKKKIIVSVPEEVDPENYCMECGVAMGVMNPRQLCGKWRCLGYGFVG
ncbi:MAG: hypothetical protein ACTSUE_20485 [Promethearchaeota archaeon]